MKRILFLLLLALLGAGRLSAQHSLPGQLSLELSGGPVDGLILRDEHAAHSFFGRLALNRYNRNRTRWSFGAAYLQKDYAYKTTNLPMAQFTGEAGCVVPLLSDRRRNFIVSAGLSAAAGYETTG